MKSDGVFSSSWPSVQTRRSASYLIQVEAYDDRGRFYTSWDNYFDDIGSVSSFYDIAWLANDGITFGCGPGLYCPNGQVTRDQMASFLARAAKLPATGTDYFTDDEGNTHEANINRIRAAGITTGCTATTYCPSGKVRRDQMASFLARAANLPATGDRLLHRRRGQHPRGQHQPDPGGRHHHRLHGDDVLSGGPRDPRPDGVVPPPRFRRLSAKRGVT